MKTNIVKLTNNNYGKLIGEAMYCCYGTCQDDAEFDGCEIYEVVGLGVMAMANGMLFDVSETNWTGSQQNWMPSYKRGRHSTSNNKNRERCRKMFTAIEISELPF